MNVGDSSDDNLRSEHAARHVPTEAWIDAFDAQCTDAALKRLRRYALLLARLPGGEHLGDPAAYAEELVQATVADLVIGALRWEPAAKELEPYLTDVIRLRVRRDRKRATRYPHVSIDARPSDPASPFHEVEAHLAARGEEPEASSAGAMTRNMQRLSVLVAGDPLALRFLDAIAQGATTRAEIMQLAGLTRAEYYSARRRLACLLAELNPRKPAKDN